MSLFVKVYLKFIMSYKIINWYPDKMCFKDLSALSYIQIIYLLHNKGFLCSRWIFFLSVFFSWIFYIFVFIYIFKGSYRTGTHVLKWFLLISIPPTKIYLFIIILIRASTQALGSFDLTKQPETLTYSQFVFLSLLNVTFITIFFSSYSQWMKYNQKNNNLSYRFYIWPSLIYIQDLLLLKF